MARYILRVECSDAKGLIFKITQIFFDFKMTIED